ncbi:MAG: F0F1 ATP synthase subunit delta [Proteobacteria bacterium]|nr:MAG: F0F1 ATP synthase subunit delta [Pseudomonadota bacterium]
MSELTTAARPYAKAVFEMAQSSGNLQVWSEQLKAMAAVVNTAGSQELLNHPRATRQQKVALFVDAVEGAINEQGRNLLMVLAENDRFALLPEMAVLFDELKADAEGVVEAEVVTARELTNEQQSNLTAAIQKRFGREVKLVSRVDESLMGGAIVHIGDWVIDSSIQSRLKDMKAALSR